MIKTKLKRGDRKKLQSILRRRNESQQRATRARVLLELADGLSPKSVAALVGMSDDSIMDTRSRYLKSDLEGALNDSPRSGCPPKITEKQKQQIVALACSSPPEGASKWNCRLLAEEAKARKIVPSIGREAVRIILESHELKPWREKNVVRARTQ